MDHDIAEEWLRENDPEYDTIDAEAAARAMGNYSDPIWMSRNNYRSLGDGGYIRVKASSGS